MRRARVVVLAASVLLIAVNLRPAVVALSPLMTRLRDDLGIGAAGAGLLTTLPILCFGLLAPLAGRLTRRFGLELALLVALTLLCAGILLRLAPGLPALLAGSVVVGTAIAVGNTLLPVVVKRDFPHRTGLMTGAMSVMLSAGGAVAAAVTVPLAQAAGLGWRPALALWVVPAVLALVLWLPQVRGSRDRRPAAAGAAAPRGLRRDALAWAVTLFMGLQSLHFYAMTAWVPTLFTDAGSSPSRAGLLLSLAGAVALPAAAVTPVLATRRRSQHPVVVVLVLLWAAGYVGLLVAPGALAALWMVLLGVGQGIGISLALTLIALRAPDAAHTSGLSGMAQGVGYVIAAAGPLGLGALHDVSGGWTVPVIAMLVLLVPLTACGLLAARDRHVGGGAGGARAAATVGLPVEARAGLRGRVLTAGGVPIAGAVVTVVDSAGRQLGRARTTPDGAYAVDARRTPSLLICRAAGHHPLVQHRSATPSADLELVPR